jgi:hypothetical protein
LDEPVSDEKIQRRNLNTVHSEAADREAKVVEDWIKGKALSEFGSWRGGIL